MKRRIYNTLLYALLVLFLVQFALAHADPATRQLLPFAAYASQGATTCDGSAPILDQDTGSLSAMRDADGRYIIAYQDRAHGSRAVVAQHVGDHLEDLAAPVSLADAPLLSPSGVKQGSLALVPSSTPGGKSRLYYTQRKLGDDTGPYGVWCMEF